jgi:hypothetical protein
MSTDTNTRTTSETEQRDRSLLEEARDPALLRERLEGREAENLEHTEQETGDPHQHTLGQNMRRGLGMRRWSAVLEQLEAAPHPALEDASDPLIEHPRAFLDHLIKLSEIDKLRIDVGDFSDMPRERRAVLRWLADHPEIVSDMRNGGTDWFAYGPKGSGKSTMALSLVARELEVNNSAVVWRGSSARSEWLPLAPWATVCLPAGLEYEARLDPPSDDMDPFSVDLEAAVRSVKRYRNPRQLNHELLEEGGFHVVYPDPKFRHCSEITQEAEEIPELEHVSAWEAEADVDVDEPTPSEMWWFAWAIDKIENGPPMFVTWFCDEVGNLMPEHASNDYHDHYRRIEALRNKWVDARRNNFSLNGIGHGIGDLHHLMLKKIRWRITLNGTDNPTGKTVGMGEAPMPKNYAGQLVLGEGLSWNKQQFAQFSWADTPDRLKVPGQLQLRFPEVQEVRLS